MNRTIPVLCCSVAANPSPLGVKLHNAGYEALGLDYRYFAIGAADIEPVLQCMRTLAIRGLGVSMPHKQAVIPFLDEVSQDVQAIGACNTVVQENGRLYGYNTDWVGALGAIDEAGSGGLHSAVIIGAGGVARAIAYALKNKANSTPNSSSTRPRWPIPRPGPRTWMRTRMARRCLMSFSGNDGHSSSPRRNVGDGRPSQAGACFCARPWANSSFTLVRTHLLRRWERY